MKFIGSNLNPKNVEINTLVLTAILYLFRTTVPFLKFPFLILLVLLLILSIANYGRKLVASLNLFSKIFYPAIVLLAILVIGFILSDKLYLTVFKDIINASILILMFFLMSVIIESKNELNLFFKLLSRLIIVFAVLISVSLLYNILNSFSGTLNSSLNSGESVSGSISSDYNFVLLPVFFGMIAVLFELSIPLSKSRKKVCNMLLFVMALPILLSGSRRGIFTIAVILVILIFSQFLFRYRDENPLKKLGINVRWFLISIIAVCILLTGFIILTPVNVKKTTLKTLGINENSYRLFSSNLLYRYATIFSDKEYFYYQKIVWKENIDPLNPDSGWGTKVSSRVFPLTGENVEIVPKNAIGYKMDSTCDPSSWSNNAYSYTSLAGLYNADRSAVENELYYASVYCYVSIDFDGTWAYIFSENGVSGKDFQSYDFNRKGAWQKLSICFKSNGEIPRVYLYWAKSGVTDFSKIRGHIIFAYPEFKLVKPESSDPTVWGTRISTQIFPLQGENSDILPPGSIGYKMDSTSDASSWGNSAYSYTNISSLFKGDTTDSAHKTYTASVFCFVSKDFDGSWANLSTEGKVSGNVIQAYDLTRKGTWQQLQISFTSASAIPPVYLYWAKGGVTNFAQVKGYVIFVYPQYSINDKSDDLIKSHSFNLRPTGRNNEIKAGIFVINLVFIDSLVSKVPERDLIRKWSAMIISEDTTYFGYKSNLEVGNVSSRLSGNRLMRWKFAGNIFLKEFNWKQKIFGGGFNYLNWYGYYFLKDKKLSDYPHNPFFSILLYSGVIGLIIYLFFIFKLFSYYLKYFRQYQILTIFFLITFFFSFFSAGSPFDPPIMGFFMLLPFLIRLVYKKEEA